MVEGRLQGDWRVIMFDVIPWPIILTLIVTIILCIKFYLDKRKSIDTIEYLKELNEIYLQDINRIKIELTTRYKDVIAVESETLHVDFFFHGRKSPIRQSFTDVYTINEDSGKVEVTTARDKLEKFLSDDMLRFGLGKELSIYTSVDCRLFPKSSLKEYKVSYNYKEDMTVVFVLKGNKWEQLHYDCWKDSHDFKK